MKPLSQDLEEREDLGVNDDAPPFSASDVDITPTQLSVFSIARRIEFNEVDLAPAFQRNQDIWSPRRQSRLIESLILGIPISSFYFTDEKIRADGTLQSRWQVVDGLQRLCSIRNFMVGIPETKGKTLKLCDLEYLRRFEGKVFENLPPPIRRTIEEAQLTVFIIRSSTPAPVKFNIFKRLNTGGVPLSQQEIRHALNQGVAADFLREMAESPEFKKAIGGRIKTTRMADREYINRFLAFFVLPTQEYQDMDSFLNQALKTFAEWSPEQREKTGVAFRDSLSVLNDLFGESVFSRFDPDNEVFLRPINKALFEVLTSKAAKLSPTARNQLRSNREAKETFLALFHDNSEDGLPSVVSISTGRTSRVLRRHEIIADYFETVTGERP